MTKRILTLTLVVAGATSFGLAVSAGDKKDDAKVVWETTGKTTVTPKDPGKGVVWETTGKSTIVAPKSK